MPAGAAAGTRSCPALRGAGCFLQSAIEVLKVSMPGRVGLRTVPKFLNDVRSQLEIGKAPAYALLLGSGFSYPLIPTGGGMIRDIPWWLYWQSRPKPSENGHP